MEDGGWGRQQLRMKTSTGTFIWKKDKYETRDNCKQEIIATTVRHDSKITITVVCIVFPACCFFKSYSGDRFPFFRWDEEEEGGEIR